MASEALNQLIAQSIMNQSLKENPLNQMIASSNNSYGLRPDSTLKGSGFFGPLKGPTGDVSTELSIGIEFDGQERLIPTLVPTLDKSEVDYLMGGGQATKQIVDKAVDFARFRLSQGLSPFAGNEEIPHGIKLPVGSPQR